MRSLMTRLAAAALAALLACPTLLPGPELAAARAASSENRAGMDLPAGPIVSPAVVAALVVVGGSPSLTPGALASSRLAAGERVPERAGPVAVVVKSAPTILRV